MSTRPLAALCGLLSALSLSAPAYDPAAGDFVRAEPTHIRLLTWNVLNNFVTDTPLTSGPFTRILQRVQPDVIVLNEMTTSHSAATIQSQLQTILGGSWFVWQGMAVAGDRNVLASRYPFASGTQITDTIPASDARGVTAALIDLPNATHGAANLYVMGIHFKSGGVTGAGGDHERRQRHADALIAWMRDARASGGNIALAAGTPMVITGDTNIGFEGQGDEAPFHPDETLLTGDIFDNLTYGPDSPPDWDDSTASEGAPLDRTNGEADTWSGRQSAPLSRLDRVFYTDSVIRAANEFLLNTATLSAAARAAMAPTLLADDTADAADHLPIVTDFALGPEPAPGRLLINEFSYDDVGTDTRTFIEFVNVGGQELNLSAPLDHQLVLGNNLPTTAPANENESTRFDLLGAVPPGGLFVIYDPAAGTSDVAAQIEAALPPLQRMTRAGLFLTDTGPTALALVTRGHTDVSDTIDTLIEAYAYEDVSPFGHRFLRTDSTTTLLIELLAPNLSPTALTSDTLGYARNLGDQTVNSYAGWTIPQTLTPGQPNLVPRHGLSLR